jgi:hypothetical protein
MPGEDVLDHVTEGTQVRVQQSKGQTLHITASSHIPLSPQQTFALVMHPKNEQASGFWARRVAARRAQRAL